jgi:hypothetical protein
MPRPSYKLIRLIASTIEAHKNCVRSGNVEWEAKHAERLRECEKLLPSGSGFDSGTTIDIERSKPQKILLHTSFHHMDESGGYAGWTEHDVIVTPAFDGIDLRITGPNRNDIKEYMHEVFQNDLMVDVDL